MQIASKTNNVVKYIKSLNEKKYRNLNKAFIIEGIKVAKEIINSRGKHPFEFIVYSKELIEKNENGKQLLKDILNNVETKKTIEVTEEIYKYISDTVTPQGVLVVVKKTDIILENIILENIKKDKITKKTSSYIILDNIQDSGNLGTIIRSANSFNVQNIICTTGTADIYSPKVVRSAMGAVLDTNVSYVSMNELTSNLDHLKALGYKIVGTKINTNKQVRDLKDLSKIIFVMGNESSGISDEIENICDFLIKIPMEDTQESLNVGVAASILMYEKYIRG